MRTLERHFQGCAGCSPAHWLNGLRLRVAAQHLAAGMAPRDFVTELGFYDISHFDHRFKEFFHTTPSAFVARYKQREAEWLRRGDNAANSSGPADELEEEIRGLESQAGGHLVLESPCKHALIAMIGLEPVAGRAVREALAFLAPQWQFEVYEFSKNIGDIANQLDRQPAVVLLASSAPAQPVSQRVEALVSRFPGVPIIILGGSPKGGTMVASLAAGAVGHLPSTSQTAELAQAIRQALAGDACLSQSAQGALLDFLHRIFSGLRRTGLTLRESEVCILLMACTEKEVAQQLGLSTKGVDVLVRRAFRKLGIHRRRALLGAATAKRG